MPRRLNRWLSLALVAGAIATVAALVPAARRQLVIRAEIATIRERAPQTDAAVEALARCGAGELRLQLDDLYDALDFRLDASGGGSATGELICALLARVGRVDPALLTRARERERPALEPCVARALLMIGRAGLACPAPREALLGEGGEGSLCFEWGLPARAPMAAESRDLLRVGGAITRRLYIMGEGETAIARLGPGAADLAGAVVPGDADAVWQRTTQADGWIDSAEAVAGETYAFRVASPRADLVGLFHALEVEADRVRIVWKITGVRTLRNHEGWRVGEE